MSVHMSALCTRRTNNRLLEANYWDQRGVESRHAQAAPARVHVQFRNICSGRELVTKIVRFQF